MISVTRRFEFCYSHYLPGYEGKCKNVHGHNAILEVTYRRPHRPAGLEWEEMGYEGMIIDFSTIKRVVMEVLDFLDHKNLNEELMPRPTSENLLMWIVLRLKAKKFGEGLERVWLSETRDCWCEWRREARE